MALSTYRRKDKRSKINGLSLYLKKLKQQQQIKPNISSKKEIIQFDVKSNETENRKTIEESNEPKAGSLRKSIKLINLYTD